jgi:hypothetical protein
VRVSGEMKSRGDLTTTTPGTITNKVLAGKEIDGEM